MKNNNSTDAPEQRICRADKAGLPAHYRKGKKPTEAVLDLLADDRVTCQTCRNLWKSMVCPSYQPAGP